MNRLLMVAASQEGSDIAIINEPYAGSSLFLVETGESRTPSYPTVQRLVRERRALAVTFHGKEQV